MYLYRDHEASTSLQKGEGVDKESNKNDIERKAWSQISDVPHTNVLFVVTKSSLLGFS